MLPVSRSFNRTFHGALSSATTRRQPSLKSNLTPFGPAWVGLSAGAGKARLAGSWAAPEPASAAPELGGGPPVGGAWGPWGGLGGDRSWNRLIRHAGCTR